MKDNYDQLVLIDFLMKLIDFLPKINEISTFINTN